MCIRDRLEGERDRALEGVADQRRGIARRMEDIAALEVENLDLEARIAELEKSRDRWEELCGKIASEKYDLNARIAEVAKLHQPESFHDEPIESFCKTCQRTSGVWPCGTAIALGLNEGENTDV